MTWRFVLVPLILILGYIQMFYMHEKLALVKEVQLSPALPIPVLQVLGRTYMEQMISELLFIKVAVFYGGGGYALKGDNLDVITNHFLAMQELHPIMIDTYYRTEAAIADKGDQYAQITNSILKEGRDELPGEVVLPYFEGFNYYYYLDEPLKAAELLRLASTYDEKYQWLGHLASTLLAKGGNIRAGLSWLKGMHASMDDGTEKERYAKDIAEFERAMQVQLALEYYAKQYGGYPEHLDEILPNILSVLPTFSDKFVLEYQKPTLSLKVKPRK